jgi:hypothetical protein
MPPPNKPIGGFSSALGSGATSLLHATKSDVKKEKNNC